MELDPVAPENLRTVAVYFADHSRARAADTLTKFRLAMQVACSQRAAAALSSGRVLNAIAAPGAALCTALIAASNIDRLWGGRRMPAPIT
jgi:hypothetical protein